jgi:predicted RNase H-like HicB family nuclease
MHIIRYAKRNLKAKNVKIKVIIHDAEEGGYWAEIPALPGCFTQADTWQELIKNIYEAIKCHLLAMNNT